MKVGITKYLSNTKGFRGIHKHRFSDFIVREVDIFGNVAKYVSADPSFEKSLFPSNTTEPVESHRSPEEVIDSVDKSINDFIVSLAASDASVNHDLLVYVNDDFRGFLKQCLEKDPTCANSYNLMPCGHKLLRTKLHELFRNQMGSYIGKPTHVH